MPPHHLPLATIHASDSATVIDYARIISASIVLYIIPNMIVITTTTITSTLGFCLTTSSELIPVRLGLVDTLPVIQSTLSNH